MNQKNLEYLTDQVKYTGFGDDLAASLKEQIGKGGEDFKLQYTTQYGNDKISAELNFSKSKTSDMYFFNNYDAVLEKEKSKEKLEHTFYINKGKNITLKEAYNLLSGRAVNKDLTNKEGDEYNTWLQFDFKHSDTNGNYKVRNFNEAYGYDLEAALSKHQIREMGRDDFKDDLMMSLKKGNLQSVTIKVDGNDEKHYVEANPKFKTVVVYDGNMKRLGSREAKSEEQSQGEGQSAKNTNKEDVAAGESDATDTSGQKEGAKRKRGQSV